jgi:hypothetical protein
LLAAGADATAVTDQGESVLWSPAARHSGDACRALVAAGASVNATATCRVGMHKKSQHALHVVVTAEAAQALVALGASVRDTGYDAVLFSGAHGFCGLSNPTVCEALLAAGASAKAVDPSRRTPLHRAQSGDVVRLLVGAGASLLARDVNGCTPLHTAASVEVCRALLECGGRDVLEAVDARGATPLMVQLTCFEVMANGVAQTLLLAGGAGGRGTGLGFMHGTM